MSQKIYNQPEIYLIVKELLIETLSLELSTDELDDDALLLGDIPEFDSMAIVSVITGLEDTFEFTSADDELTADVFESITSVVEFITEQIS